MFPCRRGCGVWYSYERNLVRHMAYECSLLPPIPSQLQVTGSRRADVLPSRRRLPLSLPPPLPLPLPSPHRLLPILHLDSLLPPVTTPFLATGPQTSLVPPTLAALSPNLLPPPYPTPPTTLCQYHTPPTTHYQHPPSSPTPYHFQYPTPSPTPCQYLTPPPTPFLYPTPPSTPCSAPTPPILVLHQGSSPSLDPEGWKHPNLGSSHLPTAPLAVSILLIIGNPVKLPLLYLLLLLPLIFLLFLLLSLLFLHILLLPVLLLLNTGSSSLHAPPAPVPTSSFLRPHGREVEKTFSANI